MNGKYWYMRLKDSFFNSMQIRQLYADEEISGHALTVFYLRLCLMSLETGGVLEFPNGKPIKDAQIKSFIGADFDGISVAKMLVRLLDVGLVNAEGEKYKIPEIYRFLIKGLKALTKIRQAIMYINIHPYVIGIQKKLQTAKKTGKDIPFTSVRLL